MTLEELLSKDQFSYHDDVLAKETPEQICSKMPPSMISEFVLRRVELYERFTRGIQDPQWFARQYAEHQLIEITPEQAKEDAIKMLAVLYLLNGVDPAEME